MEYEKPWKRLTDWFYYNNPISQDEAGNDDGLRVDADIQHYFGLSISRRGIKEFLFGDGTMGVKVSTVQSIGYNLIWS